MASVKVYKGKRGTTYQITIYKGYVKNEGKNVQAKETITYTLEQMGIAAVSDRGNPRSDRKILEDVQLYANNLEKRMSCANYTKGDKIKLVDFVENTWRPWAENHYSASTYYSFSQHMKEIILPELGPLKIGKITPERISEFYLRLSKKGSRLDGKDNLGYSKGSILKYHKLLNSVMKLAYKYKIIEFNPCQEVEFPVTNEKGKVKYLNQEQTDIFLDILEHPNPLVTESYIKKSGKICIKTYSFTAKKISKLQYLTYKVLFRTALFSGCRIGELIALTWKDIDFDTCTLNITKSVGYATQKGGKYIKGTKTKNSEREVVIPKKEIQYLKELYKKQKETIFLLGSAWEGEKDKFDDNFVFCQHYGKIMCLSSPNRVLRRLIHNYNVTVPESQQLPQISMHCLRHTSATLLIAGGMDIKTVSARLGHKNIKTTLDIYAHPLKERDIQASEILDGMLNVKKKAENR